MGKPVLLEYCAKTLLKSGLLAGLAMLAGACAGSAPVPVGAVSSAPMVEYGQANYAAFLPSSYELRASDVIDVNVFREEKLSMENVAIGADGYVSLPLIGQIKAKGLTTAALETVLTQRLREAYLKRPAVSVNVVDYKSHRVTVEGAVEEPGVYAFAPGDRLSSAIALAKGSERVAKLSEVAVFREFEGEMAVAKFDFAQIRQGTMMDPIIEPGDRVVIGTSTLSQSWQDLLRALPAFGLFANINW